MKLAVIAWRNVWRHPFRSLILVSAVSMGLWAGLFVISFFTGMVDQKLRTGIEAISHIQIHVPGFRDDFNANQIVPDGMILTEELRDNPEVKAVAARLLARGMLATARKSLGVEIRGVSPDEERAATNLSDKVVEGVYLDEAPGRNPALVGEKFARDNGLSLGSRVVLTFQDASGEIASGAFRLAGLYKTGDARIDEQVVFVRRSDLQTLMGLMGEVHQIALVLSLPDQVDTVASVLRIENPDLRVETWREISPELNLFLTTATQSMTITMGIILLGLGFGIVNTMLMAVLERVREIGMLMALGMNRRKIFTMILLETLILVLAGCPVGMGLAAVTVAILGRTGIDLSAWAEGLAGWGLDTIVYPVLSGSFYWQVLIMVAVTAVLSSLYPARKALKLNPAEAIRSK